MSNEVRNILSCLIATAELVRDCKKELLKVGFTDEETQDILQFYVYDKVNEEEQHG